MDLLTHSLLPFFGIFMAVLVIHEAGHYFTAKLFGVKVLEAGIGLPPKVWGFTWRDTQYTINALPFGAFVRMLGEEDPGDPQSLAAQPKWKRTVILGSGAALNVILAFVLFTIGFMIPNDKAIGGAQVASVIPDSPASKARLIDREGNELTERGLKPGDEILEVNGRSVENTGEAVYVVRLSQGSNVDFTIKRNNERAGGSDILTATAYARWDPPRWKDDCGAEFSSGMTGVSLAPVHTDEIEELTPKQNADFQEASLDSYGDYINRLPPEAREACFSPTRFGFRPLTEEECAARPDDVEAELRSLKEEEFAKAPRPCYLFAPGPIFLQPQESVSYPIWEAGPKSVQTSFENLILTRNQLWKLIRRFDSEPLTGPVGIAQATGEVVEVAGWRYLIEFAATISLGLGILNFLPIPMVDGGRLLFVFIEFIRGGRRVDPRKEAMVHLAGFAVMITLFVIIAYFDTARWIRGDSLLQ
jgi:regulator of sigma E protease